MDLSGTARKALLCWLFRWKDDAGGMVFFLSSRLILFKCEVSLQLLVGGA